MDRAEGVVICCETLSAAEDGYYDLILMDIQMPNMNGHLAKPINVTELMKALAGTLG